MTSGIRHINSHEHNPKKLLQKFRTMVKLMPVHLYSWFTVYPEQKYLEKKGNGAT